jgi:hypothetical protein
MTDKSKRPGDHQVAGAFFLHNHFPAVIADGSHAYDKPFLR